MKSKDSVWRRSALVFTTLAGAFGCAVDAIEQPDSSLEVASHEAEIINGAAVTGGAQDDRGVVLISSGCTGTLISNQVVLTARHCVRTWDSTNRRYTTPTPNLSIRFETPTGTQTVASSSVLEPNTTTVNAGDYALIYLASPVTFNGASDTFFNPIYQGSDASLVNQSVFCLGYGNNREAVAGTGGTPGTPGSGAGVLRSATMSVNSQASGVLTLNRTANNQVGAPGDSGSTCFFGGASIGTRSTCANSGSCPDLNSNGQCDNGEWTNISLCRNASPDTIRTWVEDRYLSDVSVAYSFVPGITAAEMPSVTVTSPKGSKSKALASGVATVTDAGVLSGFVRVASTEPANMMCPVLEGNAGMGASVSLTGTCLNEGLFPAIFM